MEQPSPPPPPPSVYGPFWEHRDQVGLFRALFRTIGDVLKTPTASFQTMRRDGGIGGPLLFAVIVGCAMMLVGLLLQAVSNAAGIAVGGYSNASFMNLGLALVLVLLSPLIVTVSVLISSGVYHLFLMSIGGANGPYEVTFRVCCYAMSASVFGLIPCCGGIVTLVWKPVLLVIGLKEAHETTTGKALLAVILPFTLCCACLFGAVVLAGGGAGIMEAIRQQSMMGQ